MDKHTFGKSQAAINLINSILKEPGNEQYAPIVGKLLGRHFQELHSINKIPDRRTREAIFQVWRKRFASQVAKLPEVVRTHTLCVATAKYRVLNKNNNNGVSNGRH